MRAKQERENKTFKLDGIEEEEGRRYGRLASSGRSKKPSEEEESREIEAESLFCCRRQERLELQEGRVSNVKSHFLARRDEDKDKSY